MEKNRYFVADSEDEVSRDVNKFVEKLSKKRNIDNIRWSIFQNVEGKYIAALVYTKLS